MKSKHLYSVAFILFFTIQTSFCQIAKNSAAFGRYGQCTSGRGICGIEADNLNAKSATAKFSIEKENDSTLILKIQKTKITTAEEIQLFGKHLLEFAKDEAIYFQIDTALPLQQATKNILHVASKYNSIPTGLFLVNNFDSYFLIGLKLQ